MISFIQISERATVTNALSVALDSIPTRRQLRSSFFEKREVLVVYGSTVSTVQKEYQLLLDSVAVQAAKNTNRRRNIKIKFKEASAVTDAELNTNIIVFIGTPAANPSLRDFTQHIPIKFEKGGIRFNTKLLSQKEHILTLQFFPNPKNHALPFSFLTGNDEYELLQFVKKKVQQFGEGFLFQNMDFEIYERETKIQMGNFDANWFPDKTVFFDYSYGNEIVHSSTSFDFVNHQNAIPKPEVLQLATEIEQTKNRIIAFTNTQKKFPRIGYHIYKTAEDKGLITQNSNQAHLDFSDNTVHTIINAKYSNNYIQKENALVINLLLGKSKSIALERGLALYFTKQWQREGFLYWSARLAESGNALTLSELFDTTLMQQDSPLITDCMAGALVTFLIETFGKDDFLKRYRHWSPSKTELSQLQASWETYLSEQILANPKKVRETKPLSYLKGFNFAHEGYSIYNGYLSRKATEALVKQKEMGVNATAIVPYSYIREGAAPSYLPISYNAGSENDQGVVHSAYEARQLGMQTVLKPQIFIGNSWPGALDMGTDEDWAAFFNYYYRWIRHYAFLAEIHQMDALCIGVEFAIATLTHEEEWRKMIRKIRGFYQGKLTYAANWGKEFEQLAFWDELDFIGLNSYYPLSKNENPTDEELAANFEVVKGKIEKVYRKFQKPIVFTEIGFRSIDKPWKNPHAEGDDSFNAVHQQRCYEVIFRGIENEPWCHGILWWKFPTYLEYRGTENSAFTPNNKITEETVKKWFAH